MIDEQQQWLPFDFLKEEEQIEFEGLPHYENPKTDNECLFELQYQYKVNGKQEALQEIYKLGMLISEKLISVETRRNRKVKRLSMDERKMKAADAINYIICSYLRKPQWYIKKSFVAYLQRRVWKELYYHRKVDDIVDFVDLDDFYKEGTEDEWDEQENT